MRTVGGHPGALFPVSGEAALGGRGRLAEAVVEGVLRGLRSIRHLELAVDVVQVELDRLVREPQLLGDCTVGEAPGDTAEDLRLAPAQAGVVAPERAVAVTKPTAQKNDPATACLITAARSPGWMLLTR